jgi:hypothetical protein
MKKRLSTAIALLLCYMAAASSAAGFAIKQEQPDLGSQLRRRIGFSSFPLDKTYPELGEPGLRVVREAFQKLRPGDDPPFPETSLRSVITLVESARQETDGPLRIHLVMQVDENGSAKLLAGAETTNEQLLANIVSVLTAVKFRPGRCDGKPCMMEFPFSLEVDGVAQQIRRSSGIVGS